jgi:uncharacterized protein YlxW (UPF0749 family)
MNKSLIAIMAALMITTCVGVGIFAIGGAALFNKNGTTASNSPAQATSSAAVLNSPQQSSEIAQLQNLVSQYQAREKQYQQREQQLQSQLNQANAQVQADQQSVQQAQMILSALEQRGVIRITSDGRIFITR